MHKTLYFFWHNFFSYLFFFPLSLFFLILSFFIKIRFGGMRTERIGHFIPNTELYLIEKKIENNNCLDILYKAKMICNFQVYKMVRRKVFLFPPWILHVHKFFKLFSKNRYEINILKISPRDTKNYLQKYSCQLDMTDEELEVGKKQFIDKFNCDPDNEKIVYLAVRDSEYLKKQFPKNDWSYHNYRDWDIARFIPACEYLASIGYKVFRMGKFTNQKFNINNPNIIDYVNSKHRSDILDIFIAKKSCFSVSTGCGIDAAPLLFRKPMAMIHLPFELSEFHNQNIIMTQHHYSLTKNRNLSMSEIFKEGSKINFAYTSDTYKKLNIKLIQNSPIEILDLVKEMHLNLNVPIVKDNYNLKLEKDFWEIFNFNLKKYNLDKVHGQISGKFSLSFLKNNPYFLN